MLSCHMCDLSVQDGGLGVLLLYLYMEIHVGQIPWCCIIYYLFYDQFQFVVCIHYIIVIFILLCSSAVLIHIVRWLVSPSS